MVKRILFVCTGNTCRSPMAEGLFRLMAKQQGLDIEAKSAGVMAADGVPISAFAEQILKQRGIKETMTSSSIAADTVNWADLILTMTTGHKKMVVQQYPQVMDKVFTLKEFVEDDPAVREKWDEWRKVVAEMQTKLALSQPITEEEHRRVRELEQNLPDTDVADPFGGPLERYEQCAKEIEALLAKLLQKMNSQS